MPCPDRETLVMLADRELPAVEREAVQQHLVGCDACREFVDEMRALNLAGRTALQAIRVHAQRPTSMASRRRLRWPAIAAAALVAIGFAGAAWLLMTAPERSTIELTNGPSPARQSPVAVTETDRPPLLDDAFERWAAEHRQKRIPLIPMEQVATYEPTDIAPLWPMIPDLN